MVLDLGHLAALGAAEQALAHPLLAAYRRGDLFDKRRRLMAAWATFCCEFRHQSEIISFPGEA
jgi:hypothetical protein